MLSGKIVFIGSSLEFTSCMMIEKGRSRWVKLRQKTGKWGGEWYLAGDSNLVNFPVKLLVAIDYMAMTEFFYFIANLYLIDTF